MGESVEGEIGRWSGFARALRKEDREAFEEIMDSARRFESESSNAIKLTGFEQLFMNTVLSQKLKMTQLENKLHNLQKESGGQKIG